MANGSIEQKMGKLLLVSASGVLGGLASGVWATGPCYCLLLWVGCGNDRLCAWCQVFSVLHC